MKVFTEKIGGKYCPTFKFGNKTFHLKGYETKEEAEWMNKQLKVCFSNYGLMIVNKNRSNILKDVLTEFKKLIKKVTQS